jgi:amphi-Trp domain-containing protein
MTEPDFDRELRLKKEDAADFLRKLADSIEDEEQVALEGENWKVYQPYEDIIPFRITQDDFGLEVDLKMLQPDDE